MKMSVTVHELGLGKRKIEVETTAAHKCFRKKMGFNDQSDAKRMHIGLSAKKYTRTPQHILAKTLEDAIINVTIIIFWILCVHRRVSQFIS